jgi:molybdopterin-guanine dinucleotide biosynthesis protein A
MTWTIVIQAGGESKRMGQNKALLPFRGQPLIERVAKRLRSFSDELILTANHPELFQFLNLPIYPDLIPGKGSLGGLYTALSAANYPLVAVVACDMPFVNSQLLAAERDLLVEGGWDVIIPLSSEGREPLHAVYRKDACLPAIRRSLEENRLRMDSWFSDVKVREMSLDDVSVFDPELRSFMNVNTPEEFRQAEQLE